MVHIAQIINLLGCYTMQNNNSVPMFWKKVLLHSQGAEQTYNQPYMV